MIDDFSTGLVRLSRVLGHVFGVFPEFRGLGITFYAIRTGSSCIVNKTKVYVCTVGNDGRVLSDMQIAVVVLHELAHALTPERGHTPLFMKNFNTLARLFFARQDAVQWPPHQQDRCGRT